MIAVYVIVVLVIVALVAVAMSIRVTSSTSGWWCSSSGRSRAPRAGLG